MIREFARRHMNTQNVKIDEDLARQIWARGARSPPRKIRVRMHLTDTGFILVSRYDGLLEPEPVDGKDAPAVEGDSAAKIAAAAAAVGDTAATAEVPSLPEPKATPDKNNDQDADDIADTSAAQVATTSDDTPDNADDKASAAGTPDDTPDNADDKASAAGSQDTAEQEIKNDASTDDDVADSENTKAEKK